MQEPEARNAANLGLMCIWKTDAGEAVPCYVEAIVGTRKNVMALIRKVNGKKGHVPLFQLELASIPLGSAK